MADFEKNSSMAKARAIITLKNIITEIPAEIKTCEGIAGDIKAIEDWASIFTDRTKLVAKVTRNLAFHHKEITGEIGQLKTDFEAGSYFQAGKDAADLVAIAIGTVEAE